MCLLSVYSAAQVATEGKKSRFRRGRAQTPSFSAPVVLLRPEPAPRRCICSTARCDHLRSRLNVRNGYSIRREGVRLECCFINGIFYHFLFFFFPPPCFCLFFTAPPAPLRFGFRFPFRLRCSCCFCCCKPCSFLERLAPGC